MKRICKFLTIPVSIIDHPDLSVFEKWVLIAIDSVSDSNGVSIGTQGIASLTGLPSKTIKEVLKTLQKKGAIEAKIDGDGEKKIIPYLYKERYVENPNAVVIGDKPSDIQQIDYQSIVDTWNEYCGNLQRVERLTPKRRLKTRTTLKGAGCTESDMIKAIKLVSTSRFLKGEKSDSWSATYDWLIKSPENLTKVLEGNYHKDYSERRDFESIMNGCEVNYKQSETEDFYK